MVLENTNQMKEISIENCQNISGGGFCQAVAVADAVVTVGGILGAYKVIALTSIANPVFAVAGVALVGASLYCAFS